MDAAFVCPKVSAAEEYVLLIVKQLLAGTNRIKFLRILLLLSFVYFTVWLSSTVPLHGLKTADFKMGQITKKSLIGVDCRWMDLSLISVFACSLMDLSLISVFIHVDS